MAKLNCPKRLINIYPKNGQAGWIYDSRFIAPCLPGFGAGGGGKELKVVIWNDYCKNNRWKSFKFRR